MNAMQHDLLRLLEHTQPRSILVVALSGTDHLAGYPQAHPECRIERLQPENAIRELSTRGRYDFGLLAGAVEHLPQEEGRALIARMRDLHARRLCLLLPAGGDHAQQAHAWREPAIRALGLTLLARYPQDGRTLHLYGFDIATYKTTPDWLNAANWAHPELWGKFRW